MLFKELEEKTRKQIKASMKRICNNIIKLNIDNLDRINSSYAFSMWTTRYIALLGERRFYNLIEIDNTLYEDMMHNMNIIFNRELSKLPKENLDEYAKNIRDSEKKNHRFKEATPKQLYYASYLMNMLKNKPLPKRKYSMSEIGALINILKKQLKASP